ncbi:MAG TPA: hypothetical protein VIE66_03190 [Methylocella sp.]
MMENEVLAPPARVPRLQVRGAPAQGNTVLDANVVPAGSGSVTTATEPGSPTPVGGGSDFTTCTSARRGTIR